MRRDGKVVDSGNESEVPVFSHYVFATDSSKSYIESYPVASIAISFLNERGSKSYH